MVSKQWLAAALAVQSCAAAVSKARDETGTCKKTTVAILWVIHSSYWQWNESNMSLVVVEWLELLQQYVQRVVYIETC